MDAIDPFIIYLSLGALVGLLAGLLGIGGGLIIVPALSTLFAVTLGTSQAVHLAIGTSLATIMLTSISSVITHHQHQGVRWDLIRTLAPGIAIGAFAGAFVAKGLSTHILKTLFGLFELAVAASLWFRLTPHAGERQPGTLSTIGTGGMIGMVSSLMGIGGGTLTVPYLVWRGVSIPKAIGTASAAGLPIAVAGTLGFIKAGLGQPDLPALATGFVYWPAFAGIVMTSVLCAPLGARLTHRLPVPTLKRLFAGVLLILGLKMLLI